jgi:hypothetical protein
MAVVRTEYPRLGRDQIRSRHVDQARPWNFFYVPVRALLFPGLTLARGDRKARAIAFPLPCYSAHPDRTRIPLRADGCVHRYLNSTEPVRLVSDRVGYALFLEAGLGRAGEFLFGRGHIARLLRVRLAFLHEAVHRGARQFLVGRVTLA